MKSHSNPYLIICVLIITVSFSIIYGSTPYSIEGMVNNNTPDNNTNLTPKQVAEEKIKKARAEFQAAADAKTATEAKNIYTAGATQITNMAKNYRDAANAKSEIEAKEIYRVQNEDINKARAGFQKVVDDKVTAYLTGVWADVNKKLNPIFATVPKDAASQKYYEDVTKPPFINEGKVLIGKYRADQQATVQPQVDAAAKPIIAAAKVKVDKIFKDNMAAAEAKIAIDRKPIDDAAKANVAKIRATNNAMVEKQTSEAAVRFYAIAAQEDKQNRDAAEKKAKQTSLVTQTATVKINKPVSTTASTTASALVSNPSYRGGYQTSRVVYYAPDGTTAYMSRDPNGRKSIIVNNNVYLLNVRSRKYIYNGNTAGIIITNTGETAIKVRQSNGSIIIYSSIRNNSDNSNTLIDDDLYILKSQIVPPVCPACPLQIVKYYNKDSTPYSRQSNSLQRNYTPSNYRSSNYNGSFNGLKPPDYSNPNMKKYLPIPVLNSFSSFGLFSTVDLVSLSNVLLDKLFFNITLSIGS